MVIITVILIQWSKNEFSNHGLFCCRCRRKSFTKAAERLSVTANALGKYCGSRRTVPKLLGVWSPLSLTFAGEEFLRYARRFQAQRRAMDQEFLILQTTSVVACVASLQHEVTSSCRAPSLLSKIAPKHFHWAR